MIKTPSASQREASEGTNPPVGTYHQIPTYWATSTVGASNLGYRLRPYTLSPWWSGAGSADYTGKNWTSRFSGSATLGESSGLWPQHLSFNLYLPHGAQPCFFLTRKSDEYWFLLGCFSKLHPCMDTRWLFNQWPEPRKFPVQLINSSKHTINPWSIQ